MKKLLILSIVILSILSCKKEDLSEAPNVITKEISNESEFLTLVSGSVSSNGGADVTERGICYGINHLPSISDKKATSGIGIGDFTSELTDIEQGVIYYARAYATNKEGTAYGDEVSFIAGTVADIEGNIYNIVTIGNQIWMKENLMTTKYNDGTPIPLVTGNSAWVNITTPAYCWFDNDAATNKATYGALYNWYAVYESRNLAPTGWHVPSDDEWKLLEVFLGLTIDQANRTGWRGTDQGGKLKETGTSHWINNSTGTTNSSGFTALPGNRRDLSGVFLSNVGRGGWWWTTTEDNTTNAWYHQLFSGYDLVARDPCDKKFGFSVRCVKD